MGFSFCPPNGAKNIYLEVDNNKMLLYNKAITVKEM
tara:strand:- start:263 stop:370 length:108 start_codon:yes stop_codon:yes gene_type:complete